MILKWNKLKIAIRNPAGSIRQGITSSGDLWSQYMPYTYGSILGTVGVDKKAIDVIVGHDLAAGKVYICAMALIKGGEDKCLIGFASRPEAKKAFLSCYNGDINFLSSIICCSVGKFKKLLHSHKGISLSASPQEYDLTSVLNVISPVPTLQDKTTKVENPGDRKMTKKEKEFNMEIARHQGGAPSYAEVSKGADINISPEWIYSQGEKL
jgi:hypothetical protein